MARGSFTHRGILACPVLNSIRGGKVSYYHYTHACVGDVCYKCPGLVLGGIYAYTKGVP